MLNFNRIIGAFLVVTAFSACGTPPNAKTDITPNSTPLAEQIVIEETAPAIQPPALSAPKTSSAIHEQLLASMTLEQKVGQLFITTVHNAWDIETIKTLQPGGVILFETDIVNSQQLKQTTENLQNILPIPLFIAVDEEGGTVSQFNSKIRNAGEQIPTALSFGNARDMVALESVAYRSAQQLMEHGINMNFNPVADLLVTGGNPSIGSRAFGSEPDLVADCIEAVINGQRRAGLLTVVKHFPGTGSAKGNPHTETSRSTKSAEVFFGEDIVPFQKAVELDVEGIMMGHFILEELSVPAPLDSMPASINPYWIQTFLRNHLEYRGLVITDALNMKAVTNIYKNGDAAVAAFIAGADILLMPKNPEIAWKKIIALCENNPAFLAQLERSVAKILKIKESFQILSGF